MSTLMSIASTVTDGTLTAASSGGGGEVDSQASVDAIRNFIGPIVLFGIGAMAITFLIRRQIAPMIGFLAAGSLVLAIIFQPSILQAFGETIGGFFTG